MAPLIVSPGPPRVPRSITMYVFTASAVGEIAKQAITTSANAGCINLAIVSMCFSFHHFSLPDVPAQVLENLIALTAIQFRAEPGSILTRRFEEATSLRLTRGSS